MTFKTSDLLLTAFVFASIFAIQTLGAIPATLGSVAICSVSVAFRASRNPNSSPRINSSIVALLSYWAMLLIHGTANISWPLDSTGNTGPVMLFVSPQLVFLFVAISSIVIGLGGLLIGHYFSMWRDHGWQHIFDDPSR